MKIDITQADIDNPLNRPSYIKGYICDPTHNPISLAIKRIMPECTAFIDHAYINIYREQNYYLVTPPELVDWLNAHTVDLKSGTQTVKPFSFTLDLAKLSAKERKAAITAKEKFLAGLAELAPEA